MTNRLIREYNGDFGPFWQKDVQRSINMFDEVVVTDGIPRWTTNNSIPPRDLLELWAHVGKPFDFDTTIKQYDLEVAESLKQYRISRVGYTPSEEEMYEMRSAFGEGTTVVDAITNRRIQL